MYTVTRIRLKNICQYSSLDVAVSPGLTAVVGRNGSGKTTLLRAVAYALTGIVDGGWGTQQSLQKDGTSVVGYAEVGFSGEGHAYAVRRYSTSGVKFPDIITENGKIIHSGRKKVNSFMDAVFGMPCQLMFQMCWGRQGELASLLRAAPALVSSFLSMMFDTRSMERLRERIKTQMDTIAALPSDCERQLADTVKALESIPDDESAMSGIAAVEGDLRRLREEYIRLPPADTMATAATRDAAISQVEEAIADLSAQLEAMGDVKDIPDANGSFNFYWSQHEECQSAIVALRKDIDVARQRKSVLENELNAGKDEYLCIQNKVSDVMAALDGSRTHCPLCHHEIDDNAEYEKAALQYLAPGFSSRKEFDDQTQTAMLTLSDKRERNEAELVALSQKLEGMELELKTDEDMLVELSDILRMKKRDSIKSDIDKLSAELGPLRDMPVADENARARRDELEAEISRLDADRESRTRELAANQARRETLQRYRDDYEEAVRKYHVNKDARQVLADIRDALSQSRAQARYLQTRIAALNTILGRYVALTGMPFSIRLDPDSRAFVYSTSDGVEHPAAHLSGAQQAMASVALQMALFAVARPTMNLYLIDEPTEACDDGNKEVMAQMFERMNSMLASTHGVMLIVARDEHTLASCSNTLEVSNEA